MQSVQNAVLTIAGFDPSGGAGILADIKTFEQTGVYGCGITTCITYQNEQSFDGLTWLSFEEIEKQFAPLARAFKIDFVKIGLVKDIITLKSIIKMLKNYHAGIKIVWDPVLKTSSGYLIHSHQVAAEINTVLDDIYLVTPNIYEAAVLNIDPMMTDLNILITSGESNEAESVDLLVSKGDMVKISAPMLQAGEKHGSGCVLSSAITAYLEKGFSLRDACFKAKDYTYRFLSSSPTLLGFHYVIEAN